MTEHLNELEIEKYIEKGRNALSSTKLLHLEGCEKCRKLIEEQLQVHSLLKKLQPQKIAKNLFQQMQNKLSIMPQKVKRDWTFVIALILLLFIGVSILVTKQTPEPVIKQKQNVELPDLLQENIQKVNWKEILKQTYSWFNIYLLKFFVENKNLVLMFFSLFVIMLYHLIDKRYAKYLFK